MTPHRSKQVLRAEAGIVGGSDALVFGLLLFIAATLVIANAWGAIDAKFATAAAAREAARAFVEAPDADAAPARAHEAARLALLGHGRDPARTTFAIPGPEEFERCRRIVVRVAHAVPVVGVPWINRAGRAAHYTVASRYSEIVDPYRSGLAVDPSRGADCATQAPEVGA